MGMLVGQLIFNLLANKYLGTIGNAPVKADKKEISSSNINSDTALTKVEIDRMVVLTIITIFSVIFWLGFEQAGGAFTLYTDNYLDRNFMGAVIPTTVFQAINPIFILALGFPLSIMWVKMGPKNPSLIVKMALGLVLMGAGFFLMVGAAIERGGDNAPESALASMWWMVATYFVHTVAELFLSPVGLSAVSKLAPKSLTSAFMGVWFLSPFIAHTLAGFTESYIEVLGAINVFTYIGAGGIIIGIVMLVFSGKLKQMMHGAEAA
jgi:POT family proton-dependent oligopeptide transporter